MQAFFKEDHSILSMLHQLIHAAEKQRRIIDYVELTEAEWDWFSREIQDFAMYPIGHGMKVDGAKHAIFHGVRIVRKTTA